REPGAGWEDPPAPGIRLAADVGLAALDAGLLLELDLVARADDVVVLDPVAVDRHRGVAGDVQDLLEDLPDPADGLPGEIEIELVHAVDDLRGLGRCFHCLHGLLPPCSGCRALGRNQAGEAVAARCLSNRSVRIGPGPTRNCCRAPAGAHAAGSESSSVDITSIPARTWSATRMSEAQIG